MQVDFDCWVWFVAAVQKWRGWFFEGQTILTNSSLNSLPTRQKMTKLTEELNISANEAKETPTMQNRIFVAFGSFLIKVSFTLCNLAELEHITLMIEPFRTKEGSWEWLRGRRLQPKGGSSFCNFPKHCGQSWYLSQPAKFYQQWKCFRTTHKSMHEPHTFMYPLQKSKHGASPGQKKTWIRLSCKLFAHHT